jgi:hypothetical protein
MLHVLSHSRHRHIVVTLMTFASVSTALHLQNGHMVGRVTGVLNRGSDIVFGVPEAALPADIGRDVATRTPDTATPIVLIRCAKQDRRGLPAPY